MGRIRQIGGVNGIIIITALGYNPFGEEIRRYSRRDKLSGGVGDKYKFTGKESGLDYFSGIGWLTPGARYYDSEIGCLSLREWLSVDPMASKYKVYPPHGGAGARIIIV